MILLKSVSKAYSSRAGKRKVLDNVNLCIQPGEHLGILGRNGSGKSTLIRLIGGHELPDSGQIERKMKVSWPLAFAGGFQGSLTGFDNLRFIARIYNVDYSTIKNYVEDFSELGSYMKEPVKTYSSGMQARLAFALSLAIEFDCYLIDEVIAVGDAGFHEKCKYELFEKRKDRAFIIVSHDPNFIKSYCNKIAVLENGNLAHYEDVETAYSDYTNRILGIGS